MKIVSLFIILLLIHLSGCAYFSSEKKEQDDFATVEQLYTTARIRLDAGRYEEAITLYTRLEARYPFGKYAQQALLDLAYAHYQSEQTDAAITAVSRFIRIYPRNPYIDYAYYLKGLANFNRYNSLFTRYFSTDRSQRASGNALQAFQDFAQLVSLFPESRYATDARQRMRYLRNNLAQHEINVAHYYVRRGAFVAALNRLQYAVEHYQGAVVIPEALALMVKLYKILEMDALSQDTLQVLQLNYPAHPAIDTAADTVIR